MNDMSFQYGSLRARSEEGRRHAIMRRGLTFDPAFPDGITIERAHTRDDIARACQILYEGYTEAGFMVDDGSGHRFTVYHALPTAYTLVVREGDDIIATVTLIVKSVDPLPVEHILDLSKYLTPGSRIVELSALTIARNYRGNSGRVMFPLFKYIYEYSLKALGATDLIVTCNPKHQAFYKAIYQFESISDETVQSYDFVDGAPAVGCRLCLRTFPEVYFAAYGTAPARKNLYQYMVQTRFDEFDIARHPLPEASGNRWSETDLAWMLKRLATGRSSLSDNDMEMLRLAYSGAQYDHLFATRDAACDGGQLPFAVAAE